MQIFHFHFKMTSGMTGFKLILKMLIKTVLQILFRYIHTEIKLIESLF